MPSEPPPLHKNDPDLIFGWSMYDWANSAYITTAVGLLPIFFAGTVVGPQGTLLAGEHFRADTLWGITIGLAGAITFLLAPVLGAVADFCAAKKRFLLAFAYTGSLFTILFYFSGTGDVTRTLIFFLVTQLGFVNANVFYDAFLPHIASEEHLDRVSARGYAYGYFGGGLQFAIALTLVALHDSFGLSREHAARIAIATSGVWWAGFTLVTLRYLREAPATQALPPGYAQQPRWLALLRIGFGRTWRTALQVAQFRHLLLFLVAFMLYNEGIQTVIAMATSYGTVELGLSATHLLLTLLIIQFVAIFGSLSFSWIAGRIGTRRGIVLALLLWTAVVIYAYFIRSAAEFFVLGMVVGIAMGGSQALSRSYYGSMIPHHASAEFFGFYTVFSKFSAIWGPWVFALITHTFGSARQAILSLVVFFLAGLVLLLLVNERRAREARHAVFL